MIDGTAVYVPVSDAVYAHWDEQFVRPNPSDAQKKRFKTLMNVARAAYRKGQQDGP